ncbi:MAG: hypothetical protein ABI218_03470 [Caldimonas sp.]
MLALPMHGIAGAMPGCGSMSMTMSMTAHPAPVSVTSQPAAFADSSMEASTEHADGSSPCGGRMGDTGSSAKAKLECAGAGACGVVPMQAPAMSTLLHLSVRTIANAAPATAPSVGFLTGAPERPPRTLA